MMTSNSKIKSRDLCSTLSLTVKSSVAGTRLSRPMGPFLIFGFIISIFFGAQIIICCNAEVVHLVAPSYYDEELVATDAELEYVSNLHMNQNSLNQTQSQSQTLNNLNLNNLKQYYSDKILQWNTGIIRSEFQDIASPTVITTASANNVYNTNLNRFKNIKEQQGQQGPSTSNSILNYEFNKTIHYWGRRTSNIDLEFLIDPEIETSWRDLSFIPELVIGLTSVFRKSGGGDYLFLTLVRLFNDHFDASKTVVVVALTDIDNPGWQIDTRLRIIRTFPQFYKNGNLHIIVPPRRFYPHYRGFSGTGGNFPRKKFKDKPDRIRWRTKQNLDVSFLLLYCSFVPRGTGQGTSNQQNTNSHQSRYAGPTNQWFLMLEDDIATTAGFDTDVVSFVAQKAGIPLKKQYFGPEFQKIQQQQQQIQPQIQQAQAKAQAQGNTVGQAGQQAQQQQQNQQNQQQRGPQPGPHLQPQQGQQQQPQQQQPIPALNPNQRQQQHVNNQYYHKQQQYQQLQAAAAAQAQHRESVPGPGPSQQPHPNQRRLQQQQPIISSNHPNNFNFPQTLYQSNFIHTQYTYLGLIGKLFPIHTVLAYSKFIFHFSDESPVDWLIWLYLDFMSMYPISGRVMQDSIGVGSGPAVNGGFNGQVNGNPPTGGSLRHDIVHAVNPEKQLFLYGQRFTFIPKCSVPFEIVETSGIHLTVTKGEQAPQVQCGQNINSPGKLGIGSQMYIRPRSNTIKAGNQDIGQMEEMFNRYSNENTQGSRFMKCPEYTIKITSCATTSDPRCKFLRVRLLQFNPNRIVGVNDKTQPVLIPVSKPTPITGITLIFSKPMNLDMKIMGTRDPRDCDANSGQASIPKQWIFPHFKVKQMSSWQGYIAISCLLINWQKVNDGPHTFKLMIHRSRYVGMEPGQGGIYYGDNTYGKQKAKEIMQSESQTMDMMIDGDKLYQQNSNGNYSIQIAQQGQQQQNTFVQTDSIPTRLQKNHGAVNQYKGKLQLPARLRTNHPFKKVLYPRSQSRYYHRTQNQYFLNQFLSSRNAEVLTKEDYESDNENVNAQSQTQTPEIQIESETQSNSQQAQSSLDQNPVSRPAATIDLTENGLTGPTNYIHKQIWHHKEANFALRRRYSRAHRNRLKKEAFGFENVNNMGQQHYYSVNSGKLFNNHGNLNGPGPGKKKSNLSESKTSSSTKQSGWQSGSRSGNNDIDSKVPQDDNTNDTNSDSSLDSDVKNHQTEEAETVAKLVEYYVASYSFFIIELFISLAFIIGLQSLFGTIADNYIYKEWQKETSKTEFQSESNQQQDGASSSSSVQVIAEMCNCFPLLKRLRILRAEQSELEEGIELVEQEPGKLQQNRRSETESPSSQNLQSSQSSRRKTQTSQSYSDDHGNRLPSLNDQEDLNDEWEHISLDDHSDQQIGTTASIQRSSSKDAKTSDVFQLQTATESMNTAANNSSFISLCFYWLQVIVLRARILGVRLVVVIFRGFCLFGIITILESVFIATVDPHFSVSVAKKQYSNDKPEQQEQDTNTITVGSTSQDALVSQSDTNDVSLIKSQQNTVVSGTSESQFEVQITTTPPGTSSVQNNTSESQSKKSQSQTNHKSKQLKESLNLQSQSKDAWIHPAQLRLIDHLQTGDWIKLNYLKSVARYSGWTPHSYLADLSDETRIAKGIKSSRSQQINEIQSNVTVTNNQSLSQQSNKTKIQSQNSNNSLNDTNSTSTSYDPYNDRDLENELGFDQIYSNFVSSSNGNSLQHTKSFVERTSFNDLWEVPPYRGRPLANLAVSLRGFQLDELLIFFEHAHRFFPINQPIGDSGKGGVDKLCVVFLIDAQYVVEGIVEDDLKSYGTRMRQLNEIAPQQQPQPQQVQPQQVQQPQAQPQVQQTVPQQIQNPTQPQPQTQTQPPANPGAGPGILMQAAQQVQPTPQVQQVQQPQPQQQQSQQPQPQVQAQVQPQLPQVQQQVQHQAQAQPQPQVPQVQPQLNQQVQPQPNLKPQPPLPKPTAPQHPTQPGQQQAPNQQPPPPPPKLPSYIPEPPENLDQPRLKNSKQKRPLPRFNKLKIDKTQLHNLQDALKEQKCEILTRKGQIASKKYRERVGNSFGNLHSQTAQCYVYFVDTSEYETLSKGIMRTIKPSSSYEENIGIRDDVLLHFLDESAREGTEQSKFLPITNSLGQSQSQELQDQVDRQRQQQLQAQQQGNLKFIRNTQPLKSIATSGRAAVYLPSDLDLGLIDKTPSEETDQTTNVDITMLFEATKEFNPQFYIDITPRYYFRHMLSEAVGVQTQTQYQPVVAAAQQPGQQQNPQLIQQQQQQQQQNQNRRTFFYQSLMDHFVLRNGNNLSPNTMWFNADNSGQWHSPVIVNTNPESPKHLTGKMICNLDGVRLGRLLWLYTNMLFYLKGWHLHQIAALNRAHTDSKGKTINPLPVGISAPGMVGGDQIQSQYQQSHNHWPQSVSRINSWQVAIRRGILGSTSSQSQTGHGNDHGSQSFPIPNGANQNEYTPRMGNYKDYFMPPAQKAWIPIIFAETTLNCEQAGPPSAIGWSELWKTSPLVGSFQDDFPSKVLLEHVGHFSSLDKKIQNLHDTRAGLNSWNRDHFDPFPEVGKELRVFMPQNGQLSVDSSRSFARIGAPFGQGGFSLTLEFLHNKRWPGLDKFSSTATPVQYLEFTTVAKKFPDWYLEVTCVRSEQLVRNLRQELKAYVHSVLLDVQAQREKEKKGSQTSQNNHRQLKSLNIESDTDSNTVKVDQDSVHFPDLDYTLKLDDEFFDKAIHDIQTESDSDINQQDDLNDYDDESESKSTTTQIPTDHSTYLDRTSRRKLEAHDVFQDPKKVELLLQKTQTQLQQTQNTTQQAQGQPQTQHQIQHQAQPQTQTTITQTISIGPPPASAPKTKRTLHYFDRLNGPDLHDMLENGIDRFNKNRFKLKGGHQTFWHNRFMDKLCEAIKIDFTARNWRDFAFEKVYIRSRPLPIVIPWSYERYYTQNIHSQMLHKKNIFGYIGISNANNTKQNSQYNYQGSSDNKLNNYNVVPQSHANIVSGVGNQAGYNGISARTGKTVKMAASTYINSQTQSIVSDSDSASSSDQNYYSSSDNAIGTGYVDSNGVPVGNSGWVDVNRTTGEVTFGVFNSKGEKIKWVPMKAEQSSESEPAQSMQEQQQQQLWTSDLNSENSESNQNQNAQPDSNQQQSESVDSSGEQGGNSDSADSNADFSDPDSVSDKQQSKDSTSDSTNISNSAQLPIKSESKQSAILDSIVASIKTNVQSVNLNQIKWGPERPITNSNDQSQTVTSQILPRFVTDTLFGPSSSTNSDSTSLTTKQNTNSNQLQQLFSPTHSKTHLNLGEVMYDRQGHPMCKVVKKDHEHNTGSGSHERFGGLKQYRTALKSYTLHHVPEFVHQLGNYGNSGKSSSSSSKLLKSDSESATVNGAVLNANLNQKSDSESSLSTTSSESSDLDSEESDADSDADNINFFSDTYPLRPVVIFLAAMLVGLIRG